MTWKCDCCGLCCRHIGDIPALQDLALADGSCMYLDEENKCSIYEHRPKVCNVRYIYEHYFKPKGVSEEDFYAKTQEACDKLKSELISSEGEQVTHVH